MKKLVQANEVIISKKKYGQLQEELKGLKEVKQNLLSKIKSEKKNQERQQKLKDKEILSLKQSLDQNKTKMSKSEVILTEQTKALENRKHYCQEMQQALSFNEGIIEDTHRLASRASKMLLKHKDAKEDGLAVKIGSEINTLAKRKDYALKYRKELIAKEKLLIVSEKLLLKKGKLEKRLKATAQEVEQKFKVLEKNINLKTKTILDFEKRLRNTNDEIEMQGLSECIDTARNEYNSLIGE